jgi:hypothetical protein
MTTLHVETQLTTESLLKAVSQLNSKELDEFAAQVLAIRARQYAPSLPPEEAELLIKINEGLPSRTQKRYNELIVKRRNESLTQDEHDELLQLTQESEKFQVKRMEYLSALAQIQHTTLTKLMKQLGINPSYD